MENDMLSSLLSDPEALQNAMKTVSDLLGGQPSAQTEPQNAYDPASEMMQKALPVIGAIAQSGQNAVKPEKRALLGALKPFVAEEVSGQFDRALRLVSIQPTSTEYFFFKTPSYYCLHKCICTAPRRNTYRIIGQHREFTP